MSSNGESASSNLILKKCLTEFRCGRAGIMYVQSFGWWTEWAISETVEKNRWYRSFKCARSHMTWLSTFHFECLLGNVKGICNMVLLVFTIDHKLRETFGLVESQCGQAFTPPHNRGWNRHHTHWITISRSNSWFL